jgi:peptidyl-prolyl cis-trans isomerase D
MMEALRNGAKSWVAKILLGLLVASFAVWGIKDMFGGFQSADLVTVGGKKISSETFRVDLNRSIQQFGQQTGQNITLEDARKLGVDKQVLDRLIAQASLDSQAERLGVSVGDQAVATVVQKEPFFLDTAGKFDASRFRNLLQQNGMTEQGYIANTKSEMQRRAFSDTAGENIALPRTMVDALTRYRDESRDGRYVSFAVTEADVPAPTDDDLKKQYEATPAAYTAPEYRSVVLLKIDPTDLASKIQVTDQEISDLYNTAKEEYFQPEKRNILQVSFADVAAAEKAKARIDAGEDIVKVAAELGQKDKDITFNDKQRGDFLDEKIAEAAFTLAEGTVSAPVAGTLNTALLKVLKINPANQPTLDAIKPELTKRLQLQKAQEEIQSVYDAVEDARAQQTKFEDIGAKAGVPVIVIPAVSQSGVNKAGQPVSIPAQEEVLKAVFASDVGLDTDAIQANEGYIWFDVREVTPSAIRPQADVKDQVKADWVATKLRTLASDKAKAIVEKSSGNTKLETLATELNGTIKTVTGIKRSSVSEDFDGNATTALFGVPEKALNWSLEGDGKTARIIEVTKVSLPTSGASASAKEISDLTKKGLSSDLMDSYLKSARAGTTVTLNEELWRQIGGNTQTQ